MSSLTESSNLPQLSLSPRVVALLNITIQQNTFPPLINQLIFKAVADITAVVFYGKPQEKVCDQAAAYIIPFISGEKLTAWIKKNNLYLDSLFYEDKNENNEIIFKSKDLPAEFNEILKVENADPNSLDESENSISQILFNYICVEAGNYLGKKFLADFDMILKEVLEDVIFASGLNV